MDTVTVAQMRQIEKNSNQLGVTYFHLMDNAATACVERLTKTEYVIGRNIAILCGNGNNGGDGLAIARKLFGKGANPLVILCKGLPRTKTAHQMMELLKENPEVGMINAETDLPTAMFYITKSNIIIDCIFGTGFRGELSGIEEQILAQANATACPRLAVDIPSGMNGDTGSISKNTFRANTTYVLGRYKRGHASPKAAAVCGKMELMNIGIPKEAMEDLGYEVFPLRPVDLPALLPLRKADSHKGDYGKLLNIAGSSGMGGAAMISTLAALRCGAGITTLATVKSVALVFAPHIMEAMTIPLEETDSGTISDEELPRLQKMLNEYTACLIGCGLGNSISTQSLVQNLILNLKIPMVIDADGINALEGNIDILQQAKGKLILTPHPKEFSRLIGKSVTEINENREQEAYRFVKKYKVTLVLKGHQTLVALPNGRIFQNLTGNAALAKGGSGDILAGMIASFLAQGFAPENAAKLGVCLHGVAGERCSKTLSMYGVLARDIIKQVPLLLQWLESKNQAAEKTK